MRPALVVPMLLVLGFVAGTGAAALQYFYGDMGPCGYEGLEADEHSWWPYGSTCPANVERPAAATVAGTLVAIAAATAILFVGWWKRERGWARGAFGGVLMLGVAGFFAASIQAPASVMGILGWTPAVAVVADWLLTPEAERHAWRALAVAVGAGLVLVVAVVLAWFGWWPFTVAALVLEVAVSAACGHFAARALRPPRAGVAS